MLFRLGRQRRGGGGVQISCFPHLACIHSSRPFFQGFFPFALFPLRSINHCWVWFDWLPPYFSCSPAFLRTSNPLPFLSRLPSLILPCSHPPVLPQRLKWLKWLVRGNAHRVEKRGATWTVSKRRWKAFDIECWNLGDPGSRPTCLA